MPLWAFACVHGHTRDVFEHTPAALGARTIICETCQHTMAPTFGVGRGLTFIEEGRPLVLEHLGPQPITVRSHEEHKRVMREHGVEWATKWAVNKTGGWV